jgi:signal recognition particle subunit SRP9
MYKTFSSIILNRFEALNLRLLSQIANVRPKARPINTGAGDAGTPAAVPDEDDPMMSTGVADATKGAAGAGIERTGTPAGASKAGGGGKKKKKGKK